MKMLSNRRKKVQMARTKVVWEIEAVEDKQGISRNQHY